MIPKLLPHITWRFHTGLRAAISFSCRNIDYMLVVYFEIAYCFISRIRRHTLDIIILLSSSQQADDTITRQVTTHAPLKHFR